MGYETKLLIGRPSEHVISDNAQWFNQYASIDLCKCGKSEINDINSESGQPIYIYDSSDNRTTEDPYETTLKAIPIADVLKAIDADNNREDYRRYKWAYALLSAMAADNEEPLFVVLYGH